MPDLDYDLLRLIDSVQPERVLVALSGGVDSVVLLHLASALAVPVTAVHVNHHLSPQASIWQAFCESLCRRSGIVCVVKDVVVENSGQGVEDAARDARYRALSSEMKHGDLLLTAHHQQDQVETFFLRLLRGAGWRGLAAMTALRPFGTGLLGRPFLSVPKSSILAHARAAQLEWVEDESNASTRFDRNRLRLEVLPALYQHWPTVGRQVVRSAGLLREADDLLEEYGAQDLVRLGRRRERVGESLSSDAWLALSPPRRRHVLRTWLTKQGLRSPERGRYDQVEHLLQARPDRAPVLEFGDCTLRTYRQRLYCLPRHWSSQGRRTGPIAWNLKEPLALDDGSFLMAQRADEGLRADRMYNISYRTDGLRSHPHGRAHSQRLKKLLQDHGLEPWLRDQLPLLWDGERLAAVADLWVERDYFQTSGSRGSATGGRAVQIHWQHRRAD